VVCEISDKHRLKIEDESELNEKKYRRQSCSGKHMVPEAHDPGGPPRVMREGTKDEEGPRKAKKGTEGHIIAMWCARE